MQIVVGLGLIGAGAVIGFLAIQFARRKSGIQWETVEGVITLSRVQFAGEFFNPLVEYSYHYNGREFRSRKIRRTLFVTNWRSTAERLVAAFPVGMAVSVYIDPHNPMEGLLEPPQTSYTASWALGILGVSLIFVGLLLLKVE